jgi:hypothetical protein
VCGGTFRETLRLVPHLNRVVLVTFLVVAGIVSLLVLLVVLRTAKNKAQGEARRRAELIRQRLEEPPKVEYRKVEIRLGHHGGG